jgi:hypothetical protein
MLALYRSARQAEALEVYRRTRAYLAKELGLEPGPELKALEREILEQAPTLDTSVAAGVVPAPPTPTIGRERDIAALATLIERPGVRLITVTGTAGSTRLA